MVESCRIFTYSPQNIYANDYYNACKHFDDIRNRVISYERSCDDRESPKYKKMMDEFTYWDAQVPLTSNKAGAEEEKLMAKKDVVNNQNHSTSPYYVNDRLDYLA